MRVEKHVGETQGIHVRKKKTCKKRGLEKKAGQIRQHKNRDR